MISHTKSHISLHQNCPPHKFHVQDLSLHDLSPHEDFTGIDSVPQALSPHDLSPHEDFTGIDSVPQALSPHDLSPQEDSTGIDSAPQALSPQFSSPQDDSVGKDSAPQALSSQFSSPQEDLTADKFPKCLFRNAAQLLPRRFLSYISDNPFVITIRAPTTSLSTTIRRPILCIKVKTMIATLMHTATEIFSRILRLHSLARTMVSVSLARLSENKTISAVSMATGVPAAPIAMPTSAAARAGPSFTPSPTMPTFPLAFQNSYHLL